LTFQDTTGSSDCHETARTRAHSRTLTVVLPGTPSPPSLGDVSSGCRTVPLREWCGEPVRCYVPGGSFSGGLPLCVERRVPTSLMGFFYCENDTRDSASFGSVLHAGTGCGWQASVGYPFVATRQPRRALLSQWWPRHQYGVCQHQPQARLLVCTHYCQRAVVV